MLTATQEDYIEAISRIAKTEPDVHVTELAARLGCRLPTVTRTVRRMVELGYVAHESRGTVQLTETGRATAEHLVHRHEDLVTFLHDVLGLGHEDAENDACQLEHGMSALAAQRLHGWLQHLDGLSESARERMLQFRGRTLRESPDFSLLPEVRNHGWRG
jgi:DtxR family Mn-dependent transcriptional regulator